MKPIKIVPFILLGLLVAGSAFPRTLHAQSTGEDVLNRVQGAVSQGDAVQLLNLSAEQVEVGLFGVNTLYSRSQARYVIESFFVQYPPRSFQFSRPSKTGGSLFATGVFKTTAQEQPLRIYVRLRSQESDWKIREIRIENAGAP